MAQTHRYLSVRMPHEFFDEVEDMRRDLSRRARRRISLRQVVEAALQAFLREPFALDIILDRRPDLDPDELERGRMKYVPHP